jgi:hypothetical protein
VKKTFEIRFYLVNITTDADVIKTKKHFSLWMDFIWWKDKFSLRGGFKNNGISAVHIFIHFAFIMKFDFYKKKKYISRKIHGKSMLPWK